MWRWSRVVVGAVAALSGIACEKAPYDRAPYAVGSVAGVLYSNLLVVTAEEEPTRVGGELLVTYPLLFQNAGAEPAQLGVSSAAVLLNGVPGRASARCAERGGAAAASVDLPPGRRVRVNCEMKLTPAGLAEARTADSQLTLAVPVLSAGRVLSPEFSFRLKLEDAS
jgi:hypothetical protein